MKTIAELSRQNNSPASPKRTVEWKQVTRDTREFGRRFQAVMREMDRHYSECDAEAVVQLMFGEGCHYYFGIGDNFELALGYQWDADHAKFQIRSVGFQGNIEPHEALDLIADHVREFLRRHQQSCAYAIQPNRMDNPRIVQLYGLVPWRSDWRVSGGHQVAGGTYWRFDLLGE